MNLKNRIVRGIRNPSLFGRLINRIYYQRGSAFNAEGYDLFSEDFDSAIILDACRADLFEDCNNLPGETTRRISRGSTTTEWLAGNVAGRTLHDTVYVTANPQYSNFEEELKADFFDVVNVWNSDAWDDTLQTVPPNAMAETVEQMAEEYSDKRLLIHFVQPHYPFITDEEGFSRAHYSEEGGNVWNQIVTGELQIKRDEIWRLYRENLELTLPYIRWLLTEVLTGRIIVTADHGNAIGDRVGPVPIREWGHPRGIYARELVEVPWHIYHNGERRKIKSESPRKSISAVDRDQIESRLRSLGYAE